MPSLAVAQAFESYLASGSPPDWNGIPLIGIDELPYPPEATQAFIVIQYPVVNSSQAVLGRRFFEEGAARIVLSMERGIGLAQGLEWADGIAALFRVAQIGEGVETFAPNPPLIDDTNETGRWYTFAIIVPYRYQFDG